MCGVPYTVGWLLILTSDLTSGRLYRPLLFIGRFISGMGIGAASLVVPVSRSQIIL